MTTPTTRPPTTAPQAPPLPPSSPPLAFNVERIREDFPILRTKVGAAGGPLVYLDNGATTQKPQAVIDATSRYYGEQNSNIHRGVYELSQTATAMYESVRRQVQHFIHARESAEIIFTRGTTESINLVAASWGRANLTPGDIVVVSHLEHHSNIVPWQMICAATGAELRVIPIDDAGELILGTLEEFLATGRVRMIAVNYVSNSLGTINPVRRIIEMARRASGESAGSGRRRGDAGAMGTGPLVLVDAAQWVAHGTTDVQELDADFFAFSAHKMMGPTGVGVLYGKRALLEAMPPYQGGGDMIESVRFEKTAYAGLPNKFEAGTPNIAGVAGLGAAIEYLTRLGLEKTAAYEHELLAYATQRLAEVPGLRIIGTAPPARKASVISFVMDGPPAISTLDVGMKLDREGICVRTGHHCCQPVMERFGVAATVRASFSFYNTRGEVDALTAALKRIAGESAASNSGKPSSASPAASAAGSIDYPARSAKSVRAAAEALAEEFAFVEESALGAGAREAKSEYVMDTARKLPHLFDLLKQVTQRVPGCMSQVYMVGREQTAPAADASANQTGEGGSNGASNSGILEFVADADAEIVRGLIAILQRLYSGQPAREILAFDIEAFFQRIGLDQFITSQRRNGLAGMVTKIRAMAADIAAR